MNKRNVYEKPKMFRLGTISELTFGRGGSSVDGSGTFTQAGKGNDRSRGGAPAGRNTLPPRSPRTPRTP